MKITITYLTTSVVAISLGLLGSMVSAATSEAEIRTSTSNRPLIQDASERAKVQRLLKHGRDLMEGKVVFCGCGRCLFECPDQMHL